MNEVETLRDFFARKAPQGVLAACLFGSRAGGVPRAASDVDVGVVLDPATRLDPSARFDLRLDLTGRLIHALHALDLALSSRPAAEEPPFEGREAGRGEQTEDG